MEHGPERNDLRIQFEQLIPPLGQVLRMIRLQADSARNAYYELLLIQTPSGFLIVKRSGSLSGRGCDMRRWTYNCLTEAEHKFLQIIISKLDQNRMLRKYFIVGAYNFTDLADRLPVQLQH